MSDTIFSTCPASGPVRGVGREQLDRHPGLEGVAEHLAVADDENVGHRRVRRDLAVQQALQAHQVVGEDLLGGIQGELVGGVFGLGDCALDQAGAVAVGDQLRNQDPARRGR